MTKKHYEAIAQSIKSTLGSYPESIQAMRMLSVYLSSTFEIENPELNRDMFLSACGVSEWCDICNDTTATRSEHCTKCNEQHNLCTMCWENGHMEGGTYWNIK